MRNGYVSQGQNGVTVMPNEINKELSDFAVKQLRRFQQLDREVGHIEADGALTSLLASLGYEEVVREYDKVSKWYA